MKESNEAQRELNESEWRSEDNWSHSIWGVYFSKRDTRLWVPKKWGIGWTINFGRPSSVWWFSAIIGLCAALPAIIAAKLLKG
jgi:uncharacterized membrane protein